MIDIAVLLEALAFVALVGFLIPILVRLKTAVGELAQLLARLNTEIPPLLHELRETTSKINALADQARGGVAHASVLLHAVGEVGESVQQVHQVVCNVGTNLVSNFSNVLAGFRAAANFVKERIGKRSEQGGMIDGR